MSIRDVEKFLELVKADAKLKKNIVKTIKTLQIKEGKSFNEDQLIENVIIPLAQKRGINFTEKDFLNYADRHVPDFYVYTKPDYMEKFFGLFKEAYGSTKEYMNLIGITDEQITKLKSKFIFEKIKEE